MAKKIVVLEDHEGCREVMQRCLADRFYPFDSVFFDSAEAMKDFLQGHLHETILICLDHDLELTPDGDGGFSDPGTGREVADWLASKNAVCPVVIHSSNSDAAIGMEMVLQEAGWVTLRVYPHDDLDWIRGQWFPTVRRAIVGRTKSSKAAKARQK